MDGILVIDKPLRLTSHDVVARARRLLREKRIGHTGTLDPLATGVLPLCVGQATRLAEYLSESGKAYTATVRFGVETQTYDAEGEVVATQPVTLSRAQIEAALPGFLGEQMQVPPIYSAIKRDGKPLYAMARAGEAVIPEARPVVISRITLVTWESPDLVIAVECGKGTYIRSLAHDLGQRLGTLAHLAALRRTRSGPLTLANAVTLDELESAAQAGTAADLLLATDEAMQDYRAVIVGQANERRVRTGLPARIPSVVGAEPPAEDEVVRAYTHDGRFIAVLRWAASDGLWQPHKVLAGEG
jgi:tRNA pseudouridine55 synthase